MKFNRLSKYKLSNEKKINFNLALTLLIVNTQNSPFDFFFL